MVLKIEPIYTALSMSVVLILLFPISSTLFAVDVDAILLKVASVVTAFLRIQYYSKDI